MVHHPPFDYPPLPHHPHQQESLHQQTHPTTRQLAPQHRHHHQHQQRQHYSQLSFQARAAHHSPYVPRNAVPLPTSQPAAQLPLHHASPPVSAAATRLLPQRLPELGEHHLRRKTPNGTIDAGYDGTPAHLASGPPPLKQMILPASKPLVFGPLLQHEYYAPNQQLPRSFDRWPFQPSLPFPPPPDSSTLAHLDLSAALPPPSTQQTKSYQDLTPALALDCAPSRPLAAHHQTHNSFLRVPTALQPLYQQAPAPALFHNGAVLPPEAWPEAGLSNYAYSVTSRFPPYHGLQPSPLGHHSADLYLPTGSTLAGHAPYDPSLVGGIQVPSQRLESLTLETARYPTNGSHGNDMSTPPRFREKALAQAHRTYVELLAYVHQRPRSGHRAATNAKAPSKVIIMPKLPKSSAYGSAAVLPHHNPADLQYPAINRSSFSASHHTDPQILSRSTSLAERGRGSEMPNPAFYHVFGGSHTRFHDVDGSSHGSVSPTPLTEAKAAIEMITHLCEQSNWKWIDGILLGGCLHYGLEHYEQSLEWFQRIVSLDPSHVEAVSNVAASLYCLHRQEEAETHWMRAIRLRPAYLEAVEHLVHLLCGSHRSKEAVEIICFVQRSLQLGEGSKSGIPNTEGISWHIGQSRSILPLGAATGVDKMWDPETPGLGLSGYAVPASENGRMVALIHAKGNMLYALKDIHRAAEAFEEAVLISTGKSLKCIRSLINKVHAVLAGPAGPGGTGPSSNGPLLLPPDRARHTAQLVFAVNGELPGLRFVPEGIPKKSAISTTSNSLLSLAKIFQDAMSNGGSYPKLLRQPPGVGDILALYYLSLSLSESPSTANNVGILLASIQHTGAVSPLHMLDTLNTPHFPGIAPGSGLHLALAYYNYGLKLDNKHVHLHTNLGSLLKDIGQLDLAIQMYERAVACDGNFDIALTNLANAVKDRGRISDAIMYYKRAVNSNPHFAEAVCGLSTALNSVCDWRGRGGVMLDQGRYDRWHVDDEGMLKDARDEGTASGLTQRVAGIVSKQLADSSQWGTGILHHGELDRLVRQIRPSAEHDVKEGLDLTREIGDWLGRPWEGSRVLRLVERSTKALMRRWYVDQYMTTPVITTRYLRPKLPAQLAVPAAPTVLPFHTFTCPLTAKDIRMISQRNAARIACSTLRSPWLPDTVYPPPPPPSPQLNIGYISSDFNNHPLAHLMQSVFGFHNPHRAKAICYATTASDKSSHRQQIEREAPVFRDVSGWSAEQTINQIVKDGIHILVNLNGYTRGARNEIFAARPAPIQMSFMGFAGTLGAEWCDYLLADETAIPRSTLRPRRNNLGLADLFRDEELNEAEDWVYSENIIFCRDTFFCCDHAQSCDAGERQITWQNEQRRRWQMRKDLFPDLADDAVIMGNFNQLYKIDPATFRTWLRILSNVPKAVLWLLRFPELGENNLRRTAKAWAGEEVAKRIIFTDVAPKKQHISRARVCDVFLDTPECNAHTTAADVLWSSTPLLTSPRYPYKMCSRMAASILKGALPKTPEGYQAARELIASDDLDYEVLVTRLAGGLTYERVGNEYCEGRGRLAELRKLLFEAKWTCALFDTHRWVSDLEDAFEEAWRRWVAGESGDIYL
ncbi:glycosyltransferase family 41 protein [Xylariaceae sp. FL1272]|nr:glycosyltransferase family 41 protein [Xylariaceae sp. FL1272]